MTGTILSAMAPLFIALTLFVLFLWSGSLRYIPNNRIGVVEQLWSRKGSIHAGFIALRGEAGYRPAVLRGGFHLFWPWMCRIHAAALVTIGQGKIGYVFARDGKPLASSQALANNQPPGTDAFEDVALFLDSGGQKGPQRKILREGVYAINLAQFVVLTEDRLYALELSNEEAAMLEVMRGQISERDGFNPLRIRDGEDKIGIVTVHEGPSLVSGEIIAPEVGGDTDNPATFHNNFQDPEAFLAAGGRRGRQLQALVEGTYYLNRLFATVELIQKTTIEIGTAGVVVSYTGITGVDLTGAQYRHGELVATGSRGVWGIPLLPGKYAFNTYAGRVMAVPTTNFVLKWVSGAAGTHKLDENLAEISLITKDAFEPVLPLSVVVHIDYQKAPQVVQRFGDVRKLVEQTLDPMVSAYFKNVGQTKTLIELLQERTEIQRQATAEMRVKFADYSLELQEVLIGTPRAPEGDPTIETILTQLRQRQIAREQVTTYGLQAEAATKERELNEAKAVASMQPEITKSQRLIQVRENDGAAKLAQATKDAETIRVTAQAMADQARLEGDGQAAAITAVGGATASATKAQVDAYGGPEYRLAEQIANRMFEAVAEGHQPLVPMVVVGGNGEAGNPSGLISGLVASLLPAAGKLLGGDSQHRLEAQAGRPKQGNGMAA